MPTSHPFRCALLVVMVIGLSVVLFFFSPFLWCGFDMFRTKYHIRHYQNPEELRTWADSLIATYSSSNYMDVIPGSVTNKPPPGIPASGRFPKVLVLHPRLPDGSYSQWYIELVWGGGFMPMWGLDIGGTNFVCDHKNPNEWVPGMCFFQEP